MKMTADFMNKTNASLTKRRHVWLQPLNQDFLYCMPEQRDSACCRKVHKSSQEVDHV